MSVPVIFCRKLYRELFLKIEDLILDTNFTFSFIKFTRIDKSSLRFSYENCFATFSAFLFSE